MYTAKLQTRYDLMNSLRLFFSRNVEGTTQEESVELPNKILERLVNEDLVERGPQGLVVTEKGVLVHDKYMGDPTAALMFTTKICKDIYLGETARRQL